MFQFDAVVMDIALVFLPYFMALLIADVILVFVIRRLGAHQQTFTSSDYEKQITVSINANNNKFLNSIKLAKTRTYRLYAKRLTSNSSQGGSTPTKAI